MDNRDLILSIDSGTQSLRALIFDLNGQLIAKESVVFKPYFSVHPGWAEQDPEVFWQALCEACQKLWHRSEIARERIAGVALTAQRGTVINVDKDGTALRPAMIWSDQRKTYNLKSMSIFWKMIFKLAGAGDTVQHFRTEAEANWIQTYQPRIWEQTHKYLLLSGYLTHRLSGEFSDSVGCQVGYLPFDYRRLRWAWDRDWKWKELVLTREKLPELLAPGKTLGRISVNASKETGIPAGLRLIAAGSDKACEVIGSGCLEPSVACLSYGTTATINVNHAKYITPMPMVPAYPSAIADFYNIEVQVYRGYWMLNWFKEEFGLRDQQEAEKRGIETEEIFDELADTIPPGAMGLMLQPYWTPGLRFPGTEAKGCMIGFGDIHTRAHIYRSILEGIAYALREGKECIEKRTRIPIKSLRVCGGGSKSRNAMQITADVFGIPAVRPHVYETAGLGAAIDAAFGIGVYDDFDGAIKGMTHIGEVFETNPKSHEVYNALYLKVYKKMYGQLKPLYEHIRRITGYPK